ncbi:MAG: Gfo/Idh/MocA family oxidoreductase [Planctomycetes bacterium]|nr:Gfo/Idh/MocA family oxidoreductase [Planctomycetota bacterium]
MGALKLGVIGCGVMGTKHLQSAVEIDGVEPFAAADLIPERIEQAKAKFGVTRTYSSGARLIRDPDVEAVVLAFPTVGRPKLVMQAFKAGKHVLTEKPVAMNAGQVRRMIAARGPLVGAALSCRHRFTPHAIAAAEFISTGALGALRLLRMRAIDQAGSQPETLRPTWRLRTAENGGGILMNWGCYDLDYLLGLTEWALEPRTVLAQTWPIPPQLASHVVPDSDAETHYAALIQFEGGTAMTLERGEYMPAQADYAWQIIGTRGSLSMRMIPGKNKQVVFDETTTAKGVTPKVIWQGDEDWGVAVNAPLADFAEAIRTGRQPATPLEKALIVQQISDAIYRSAATEKAVRIK